MSEDIEGIMRGLTKAQRRELLSAPGSCHQYFAPVNALFKHGLVKVKRHGLQSWHFDCMPLGHKVRAALLSQSGEARP